MKKILFYCQHVLGMGHLLRSRALIEGMVGEFQVCFLNGGELISGFAFPDAVEVINLPPLKSDENFTGILAVGTQPIEVVKTQRAALVLETYARIQPDFLIIELFPFGRKKFAFELMPLLSRIRLNGDATQVVCSLRDIMVQRHDQFRHEDRACRIINRYFDQILVHADPAFHQLADSFAMADAIEVPVVYTGYVAQAGTDGSVDTGSDTGSDTGLNTAVPVSIKPKAGEPLVVASIGGGRVGVELLAATVEASQQLVERLPHQLLIFTGPYLPDDDFVQLAAAVAGHAHIDLQRYTNRFQPIMAQADLSISMAGYNTCMDILKTGTPAIVMPFCGGNNDEQLIRSQKLEALGLVRLVPPAELTAARLVTLMAEKLQAGDRQTTLAEKQNGLDLNGVANSVAALHKMTQPQVASQARLAHAGEAERQARFAPAMQQLRSFMEQQSEKEPNRPDDVHIFLRDDDIDVDEDTLRQLLDISLARDVPINLEVIPAGLTDAGYRLVADHKRFTPHLVELNQHGWQHLNHEREGRNCEFGVSRSYAQQYDDIAQGKALMEETFADLFSPVFTPPWNRCTEDTYRIVEQLGFSIFSGLRNGRAIDSYGFQEISVTLDLFRWKGGATLKDPNELVTDLIRQIDCPTDKRYPIGIMLHHKVMDADSFTFLDLLLSELRRYPWIHFHSFQSLSTHEHRMVSSV